MADRMPCKHCGWSEAAHEEPSEVDDAEEKRGDYDYSLATCPGYEPEDSEMTPLDKVICG